VHRQAGAFERSSDLHKNYVGWCEAQGILHRNPNQALSAHLLSAGFEKKTTMSAGCSTG